MNNQSDWVEHLESTRGAIMASMMKRTAPLRCHCGGVASFVGQYDCVDRYICETCDKRYDDNLEGVNMIDLPAKLDAICDPAGKLAADLAEEGIEVTP